jgi:hypothetical protein
MMHRSSRQQDNCCKTEAMARQMARTLLCTDIICCCSRHISATAMLTYQHAMSRNLRNLLSAAHLPLFLHAMLCW